MSRRTWLTATPSLLHNSRSPLSYLSWFLRASAQHQRLRPEIMRWSCERSGVFRSRNNNNPEILAVAGLVIQTRQASRQLPPLSSSFPPPPFFSFRSTSLKWYHRQDERPVRRPVVLVGHNPIPEQEGGRRTRRDHWYEDLTQRRGFQLGVAGPVLAACLFYWWNVETVPVSGRRRFNCMHERLVEHFGEMTYRVLMEEFQQEGVKFLPEWDLRSRMVVRVMDRLVPVSGMDGKRWDIYVVDAPQVPNAAVIPARSGGKVIVFSGLFSVARTEDAVAAVLGHEIAHNLARHEAERMSGHVGLNLFLVGSVFLLSWLGPLVLYATARPILRLVSGMPMSRAQESEADYIGLMMMAEACYDPRGALDFWHRMDAVSMAEPPEILSTHPSHRNRMVKIEEWLPEALKKREQSECVGTSHFADMLRRAFDQGYIIITS